MRIQVAVNLQSGLYIFVSKPFADEQNVRAKLNQQAGVSPAEFRIKVGLGVSSNKPSVPDLPVNQTAHIAFTRLS